MRKINKKFEAWKDYFFRNTIYCLKIFVAWLLKITLSIVLPIVIFVKKFPIFYDSEGITLFAGKDKIAITAIVFFIIVFFASWKAVSELIKKLSNGALRAFLFTARATTILFLIYLIAQKIAGFPYAEIANNLSVSVTELAEKIAEETLAFEKYMLIVVILNAFSALPNAYLQVMARNRTAEEILYDEEMAMMRREEREQKKAMKKEKKIAKKEEKNKVEYEL